MSLPKWARAPKTLRVAIHRLEVIRQHVFWIEHDLEGSRSNNGRLREEISHLERILTARWNANDARLNGAPCDSECAICAQVAIHRQQTVESSSVSPVMADHLEHVGIFKPRDEVALDPADFVGEHGEFRDPPDDEETS